jgi:hypothetical protein
MEVIGDVEDTHAKVQMPKGREVAMAFTYLTSTPTSYRFV